MGGKRAGDWYGPSSVAYILKDAMEEAGQSGKHRHLAELCIYVAQDCTIYLDDVEALCRAGSTSWRGVILFVPVRLGGERINPAYVPCIKAMLACNYCIGIIGGRPRHSLYFLGWQGECQQTIKQLQDSLYMRFKSHSGGSGMVGFQLSLIVSVSLPFQYHSPMQFNLCYCRLCTEKTQASVLLMTTLVQGLLAYCVCLQNMHACMLICAGTLLWNTEEEVYLPAYTVHLNFYCRAV